MTTFKHSGALGDLIYSLSIVKKLGNATMLVALNNLIATGVEYGYAKQHLNDDHDKRLTEEDFRMLAPLLLRQSYIDDVKTWRPGDTAAEIDLDLFRGTLFKTFEGNYIEGYHRTFELLMTHEDLHTPWLEADPIITKPVVVSRTFRYRTLEPGGNQRHKEMAEEGNLEENGIFVGTPDEHQDYVQITGVNIPYHPVEDFLELANIVAGADLIISNQNFVYSLAMGLCKSTVLETIKVKPLHLNECYFPREECQYF